MPGAPTSRENLACVRCGYPIVEPRADQSCPECGHAVADSMHGFEASASRRLRLVRASGVAWFVAVATWTLIVAVPMVGMRVMPIEWPAVVTPYVAGLVLAHGLAQAIVFPATIVARARRLSRPRGAWSAIGALALLVCWVPMARALWTGGRIGGDWMYLTLLVDWSCCALVTGAWVALQRELCAGAARWWVAGVVLAWASVAVLAVAVPAEWMGVQLPRGGLAPIRWANGLHLAALLWSLPIAVRCVRSADRGLAHHLAVRRGVMRMFEARFAGIREQSERAIAQLDAQRMRRSIDGDVNCVAVILQHVGGNLRSRFTDFLTSDGEKPWRDREGEFVDDFPEGEAGREAALAAWCSGWQALERALVGLCDADLRRTVRIRGEAHTVQEALVRALAHLSYHQGQITLVARTLVGPEAWKPISMPRGGTARHHEAMGFDPSRG